jgi:hypothetical protein
MPSGFAPSPRLIAASVLLALSCGCTGARDEAGGGDSLHSITEADLKNMKFVMGFRNAEGQPCRVVEQTIVIGDQKTRATSAMCRQPDGRWALEH